MQKVFFDYSGILDEVSVEEVNACLKKAVSARDKLISKTGEGNGFTGWVDLPVNFDKGEFERIKKAALRIRQDSEVLIVIGIGGSYLGSRAAIEFLGDSFYNEKDGLKVYFAGNSLSQKYLSNLISLVKDKDISVNVISKSGTTTEPAIAFRVFKDLMEEKYGPEGAAKRIYATTDKEKGALKELADKQGYESFVVPDDIGGRYSVLTAVGLLPIAAAGFNIDRLMEGAAEMRDISLSRSMDIPALNYAAARNALYAAGKKIEITADYEPSFHYMNEWWKQLFGESEGKGHKGIFPASADLTTDLHSMGQYIQDGERLIMETVVEIMDQPGDIVIHREADDTDKLNYLAGRNMEYVNSRALEGTMLAHIEGGVPCMRVTVMDQKEYTLGQLIYFYEFACGISGYMLGVNPFDQPGVESYKRNMFALLGKPGYEALLKEITEKAAARSKEAAK